MTLIDQYQVVPPSGPPSQWLQNLNDPFCWHLQGRAQIWRFSCNPATVAVPDWQLTSTEDNGYACELKSEEEIASTNAMIIEHDTNIYLVSPSLTAIFAFPREFCTSGGWWLLVIEDCELLCTVLNGLDWSIPSGTSIWPTITMATESEWSILLAPPRSSSDLAF